MTTAQREGESVDNGQKVESRREEGLTQEAGRVALARGATSRVHFDDLSHGRVGDGE